MAQLYVRPKDEHVSWLKAGVFDVGIFTSRLQKAQAMVAEAKVKTGDYVDARKEVLQQK